MITKIYKLIFAICAICGVVSCSDFFDQESEHVIFTDKDHLNSATDTIYSVVGILNKLQAIGDRTVLLGEVRGDLVDITSTANSDLRDMAMFNIGDDNRYNQPSDYYAIINNCNYFIANVDTALKNNRNEYIFMREYTAVKAIRAWTYLQLVLNYGSVPFVTEPILSKLDAEKDYPRYDLQAVCQYFINDLMPLTDRWADEYPNYGNIRDLRDGASRLLFFPINIVLGDLNLWLASLTGSQATYREAALRYYKYISQRNGDNSAYPIGMSFYSWYPGSTTWDDTYGMFSGGNYSSESYGQNTEMITMIAGDSIRAEGNYSELRNLFYSREENDYHVSIVPSTGMINLSESQDNVCLSTTGTSFFYAPKDLTEHRTGDLRLYYCYDEGERTDRLTGERFEVSYIDKQSFQHIHIYRRAMLYLRLAEALNGAGFPRAAFSILSTGLNNEVYREAVYPYCSESDSIWISQLDFPETRYGIVTAQEYASRGNSSSNNHNTMGLHSRGSGWTPYNEYYRLPGTSAPVIEVPTEEEEGEGGEGEGEETPIIIVEKDTPELIQEQQAFVDSLLLNENGLELAFEGTRFYDIMRFSYRQPNPTLFLAEKVAARRGKNNIDEGLKNRLMDKKNWYLQWNGQIGIK
jgi:hypothetical protein